MSQNPTFQVRDLRRKHFFQVDDAYLNGFARICGTAATCVYFALCRHANKEQESWPSITLIAEKLAMSSRTVVRAIKTLEAHQIIGVVRGKDEKQRQRVNVYVMLDKSCWLWVTSGKPEPGDKNDKSRVTKPGDTRNMEGNTQKEHNEGKEKIVDKSSVEHINWELERVRAELERRGVLTPRK